MRNGTASVADAGRPQVQNAEAKAAIGNDRVRRVWILTHPAMPGTCCVLEEWQLEAAKPLPEKVIAISSIHLPLRRFLGEAQQ